MVVFGSIPSVRGGDIVTVGKRLDVIALSVAAIVTMLVTFLDVKVKFVASVTLFGLFVSTFPALVCSSDSVVVRCNSLTEVTKLLLVASAAVVLL